MAPVLDMREPRKPRALACLLFSLLASLIWLSAVWPGRALFYDTIFKLFWPYSEFFAASLRRGDFPFWNPYPLGGEPFVGVIQAAVFYPTTYLSLVLDFPTALLANVWLHTVLGAVFMFALSRELGRSFLGALAAGLAFGFNGYFIQHYSYPSNFQSYVWLPPAVLFFIRAERTGRLGELFALALVLAAQVFGGHPQFVLYAALALAAFAAAARGPLSAGARLAAAGAAAVVLAGPQLLPTARLALESRRMAGLGAEWAMTQSLHPGEMLVMLLGPLWNRWFVPTTGDPHIVGFYLGLPLLGLAALGAREKARHARTFLAVAAMGLLLSLGRFLPFYGAFLGVFRPLAWFRFPAQAMYLFVFGAAALAGFGLDALRGSPRLKGFLLLVCAADLYLFSTRAIVTIEPEFYRARTPTIDFLARRAGDARFLLAPRSHLVNGGFGRTNLDAWLHVKDSLVPNIGMVYGLRDVYAFEEMRYARYEKALDELFASPRSRWMDVLGVRYVLSYWPLPPDKFRLVRRGSISVYENASAYPRAYFTRGERPEKDVPVRLAVDEPDRVVMELDAPQAGRAVLADAYDEGWSATLDGARVPVLRANEVQRAVAVPAGRSRIEFSYRPRFFSAAVLLSLLTLAAGVWAARRRF